MKKYKNTLLIVGSIIIASGAIFYGLSATRCHGDDCDIKKPEAKVQEKTANTEKQEEAELFPEMIPSVIREQVANKEIVLLDVREDSEWIEGHIKDAKHIPLGDLNIQTTKDLPKDIPIYIYCRSGRRAGEAEIKLKSLGFEKAENIGGIIYWQGRGGELVK